MKLKESKIYTIVFTFVITFIFVFILAYANHITRDQVKKNSELFQIRAILKSMHIFTTNDDQAYSVYQDQVQKLTITNDRYTNETLFIYDNGTTKTYSIIFTGDALWGTITGVLSVDKAVDKTIGLSFIDQNETPGLGARIVEDWFLNQFSNKTVLQTNSEGVPIRALTIILGRSDRMGNPNKDDYQVDGISGASITSAGVQKAVNKTLPKLYDLIQGVQQ